MPTQAWKRGRLAFVFTLSTLTLSAGAEPLVKLEGGKPTPSVITAWKGSGKKVELTLAAGTDAEAVAEAIESGVDRVKAKVKGGRVLVIGKPENELLPALAKIDLAESDDIGALASAALSDNELGAGSSLRAKKTGDLDKILADRATTAQGQVVSVDRRRYPSVTVKVRVLRGPTGALRKQAAKGKIIEVIPKLAMKQGRLDLEDPTTQANIGAWYLQKGDAVRVKLGPPAGKALEAILVSR